MQLTADIAKIWSVSSHRHIAYTRDDLPSDSHEGDWINIEFESTGVLRGIKKTKDYLETRRDQRGKMQVLDVFLIDSQRQKAFCETFGEVDIERGERGERWTEGGRTKDHCFLLWMTISKSQYSIEEQSLDRAHSKDGEYSEKYVKLMELNRAPVEDQSEENGEFVETILIVGFDEKSKTFFSASRCGQAVINDYIWAKLKNESKMEKGACFRARLKKVEKVDNNGDTLHRVVKLYERVEPWTGVGVNVTARGVNVELDAVVVEQRQTCFALDTEPFGLVTYPLDKNYLRTDVHVGDSLRVTLHRFKNDAKDDHPSTWHVTRLDRITKPAKKEETCERFELRRMMHSNSESDIKDQEPFSETILLVGYDERFQSFFSSSCSGEAVVPHQVWKKHGQVQLGDVFRASLRRVLDPGVEFMVLNLEKRMDVWEGVEVNVVGKDVRAILTGTIVERRETCFALETIPFGLVTYPLGLGVKGIREDVQIGDRLRVHIIRFRNASKFSSADHPSKWQVTSVKESITGEGDWFEGIVTCISGNRVFISFKHGNALYFKNFNADINLPLGTVVDICVRDTGEDSYFEVRDINRRTRTSEDVTVEKNEEKNRAMFTVTCPAEVLERCDGYFLLETPIIGKAQFFYQECPRSMRVGDTWDVKMHRRKEKRDLPSHWVAHAVVGDSPRPAVTEKSRSVEGRERRGVEKEPVEDDGQWGTVIITGASEGVWFGSCHVADTVVIPFSLVRGLDVPQKGTFYRIKCSKETDVWKAYDINPEPVHPKDFDVVKDDQKGLQVWCYARIESSQSTSFTLFNEIIGRATLPHKFARSQMRVGDEIEALYYRVKATTNPTNWMVQRVAVSSRRSTRNSETERRYGDKEERRDDDYSEKQSSSRQSSTVGSSSRGEKERPKDRRMLDKMRSLLDHPEFREIFMQITPEELEKVEKILEKDRMRSQQ